MLPISMARRSLLLARSSDSTRIQNNAKEKVSRKLDTFFVLDFAFYRIEPRIQEGSCLGNLSELRIPMVERRQDEHEIFAAGEGFLCGLPGLQQDIHVAEYIRDF